MNWQKQSFAPVTDVTEAGLAAHMRQIFNYMTAGVGLSGLTAWLTASNPAVLAMAGGHPIIFMVIWMAAGFFMGKVIFSAQPSTALGFFIGFSALTGFTLAPLVFAYTGASITTAFFTAAAMFGGASLYGYATKKSLSGWGNFLMMGIVGIIAASLVNIVYSLITHHPISGLSFVINLIAVPLFAGMTAYETNNLKEMYEDISGDELLRTRVAILGAASLYMSFVNIFISLLQLMGTLRGEE